MISHVLGLTSSISCINYDDIGYCMRLEALWILINLCGIDKSDDTYILGLSEPQNSFTFQYNKPQLIIDLLDKIMRTLLNN